jgi:response regulator of citrate/malate metabolism
MIRVLVVEDDPVAADAHRMYVERLPGFEVAGVVHTAGAALRLLDRQPVDLVLLDLNLPDGHGLRVVQRMRAAGHTADVVAVTSARDLGVVRQAVSVGVVQYLLKPFTFPSLRDRLERWARYRSELQGGEASGQDQVDRVLATLRSPEAAVLPKGLSAPTLEAVTAALRGASDDGLSANTAAQEAGVSRITARRYLEHLVDTGRAVRTPSTGRSAARSCATAGRSSRGGSGGKGCRARGVPGAVTAARAHLGVGRRSSRARRPPPSTRRPPAEWRAVHGAACRCGDIPPVRVHHGKHSEDTTRHRHRRGRSPGRGSCRGMHLHDDDRPCP